MIHLGVSETRLHQAYRMREAFHHLPEQERLREYVKWLDEEVAVCEEETGLGGIANVLKARQEGQL